MSFVFRDAEIFQSLQRSWELGCCISTFLLELGDEWGVYGSVIPL